MGTKNKGLIFCLICVILLVGILAALWKQGESKSDRLTCQSNLRVLESTVENTALSDRYLKGEKIPRAIIMQYIAKRYTRCPSTDQPYPISPVGVVPVCPYHGNLIGMMPDHVRSSKTNRTVGIR